MDLREKQGASCMAEGSHLKGIPRERPAREWGLGVHGPGIGHTLTFRLQEGGIPCSEEARGRRCKKNSQSEKLGNL